MLCRASILSVASRSKAARALISHPCASRKRRKGRGKTCDFPTDSVSLSTCTGAIDVIFVCYLKSFHSWEGCAAQHPQACGHIMNHSSLSALKGNTSLSFMAMSSFSHKTANTKYASTVLSPFFTGDRVSGRRKLQYKMHKHLKFSLLGLSFEFVKEAI